MRPFYYAFFVTFSLLEVILVRYFFLKIAKKIREILAFCSAMNEILLGCVIRSPV